MGMDGYTSCKGNPVHWKAIGYTTSEESCSGVTVTVTDSCDLSGASTCEKCAHVAFVQEISNIRSACHACECGEEFGRQCGCAHCDGNPEPYCGEDEGTEAPAVETEAPADDTDAPAVETEAPLDCCTGEFLGTAEDLACFKAPSNKNGVCDGYATEDGQYVKCTVTWGDMCRAFSLNPCQVCTADDVEAEFVVQDAIWTENNPVVMLFAAIGLVAMIVVVGKQMPKLWKSEYEPIMGSTIQYKSASTDEL